MVLHQQRVGRRQIVGDDDGPFIGMFGAVMADLHAVQQDALHAIDHVIDVIPSCAEVGIVHLVEHGDDFQASREHALDLAEQRGALMVPSFHVDLVRGVATYWWDFLRAAPQLDVVYVPIGLGSGICGAIAAKRALRHPVRIVGVVSRHATTYADSLAAGHVVAAPVSTVLADGMACRIAEPDAVDTLAGELDHVVQVSDAQVAQAMRDLFADTHNVAEGAGAAGFAAAMQERDALRGQVVGTVVSGGNVDSAVVARVLAGAGA